MRAIAIAAVSSLTLFDIAGAAPAPLPPTNNIWSGPFIGLDVAIDSSSSDLSGSLPVFCSKFTGKCTRSSFSESVSSARFQVGPSAGYNLQIAPLFVAGVEGNVTFGQASTQTHVCLDGFCIPSGMRSASKQFIDAQVSRGTQGTIRGRIGYLVSPTTLLFATGGAAFLDESVTASSTTKLGSGSWSESKIRVGYTVGGGIEMAVMPHVHVKAQYLYADYGSATYGGPTIPTNVNVNTRTSNVTIGVTYNY